MQMKVNLTLMAVILTLLEGGVILLSLIAHPDSQPGLTLLITIVFAIASGIGVWYWKGRGIIFT